MNIINKLDERFNKAYENIKIGVVYSVDLESKTCDCYGIDLVTTITNVSFSPNFNSAISFTAPQKGSQVLVGYLDRDTKVLLNISNPSTYKVTTVDNDGLQIENLKEVLDEFITKQKEFNVEFLDILKKATWSSPMGVTVATPINIVEFEEFNENNNVFLDNIQERFNNLFS